MLNPVPEEEIYVNECSSLSKDSKGRLKELKTDPYRTEFQRDIHRIIYSQPFRRLRHKTQVYFLPNNDHICTRIEHCLHVASAARTVARHLRVNEDLAEAIGLAHDIGHAPFGHHGEKVLNEIATQYELGINFQHEVHGLKVVDKLAELDREPDTGLNLTYETRDGIISHNGENFQEDRVLYVFDSPKDLSAIKDRREAGMPSTIEGCIVRMVDKITYAGRDLEDALVAGQINESDIPRKVYDMLGRNNGEIIGTLLEDLIDYSKRHTGEIGLSQDKHETLVTLIKFNYENVYKHNDVERFKSQATWALTQLFEHFLNNFEKITNEINNQIEVYKILKRYIEKTDYPIQIENEEIILDFIAGMTDNYVINSINQLYIPKSIT